MLLVPDTAASREIVVFQMQREMAGETITIWALRGSILPIQMRFGDPRDGEYGEFIFNDTDKPDPTFHNPNAFVPESTL